jgi:hypothetical protein
MRYQTIPAAVLSALTLMGIILYVAPTDAAEPCPQEVTKSKTLTGNVDCSPPSIRAQYPSHVRLDGVKITKNNVVLDCNGYSIIGPDTQSQINSHEQTEHYGIYVKARRKVTIKNCIKGSDSSASIADGTATGIKYWERGIYLENASVVTIDNNRLHHNTRYGGNAASDINSKNKYMGYGGTWRNNYFSYNGDEGIHISGGRQTSNARRLVLFNNFADHNVEEGFYFFQVGRAATPAVAGAMDFGCPTGGGARCNGGVAAGNEAHDNGSAGVYLKHSYLNNLTRIRLTNDNLQIVGSSASNTIDRVTITGGARVKFETKAEIPAGSSTCQDLIPYANTLKNICVTGSNDYSFIFEGVDTTQVGAPNVIGAISGVSSSDSKSDSPVDNAVRGKDCPFSATACSSSADDCIHPGGLGSRGNTITAFASGAHQGVTNDPNSNLTLTTSGTSNPICY